MERLQAALEKARATRTGAAPKQTRVGAGPKRPGRGTAVDEAWSAVRSVDMRVDRMRRNRVVALAGGKEAASIDMLRTKMLQQMRNNGWRRVAVTSPGSACGKTTIALNLAASMARQAELRTVLIDLDFRRPALARLLNVRGGPSFWDVLQGRASFAEQAVRFDENVIVSVNTAPAPNPSEILASSTTLSVIEDIEATYRPDVIMFDMPPMLVTDDNLAFLDKVDCASLVAAAESTTVAQVDVCERDLAAQTNFLGVILNKCRYIGNAGYEYSGY